MPRSRFSLVAVGIVAGLALVAAGALLFAQPYTFHGSALNPPVAAFDFRLTDQNAQPFELTEQTGHVVLLFFGYTNCPDVCPNTLTQLNKIKSQLGDASERVRFVLITVDPERDTPEQLHTYLNAFNPAFVGLTGSASEMEPVWQKYGIFREVRAADSSPGHGHRDDAYLVDHTTRLYAIDPRGNLRLTYTLDTDADAITQDVRQLLNGQ